MHNESNSIGNIRVFLLARKTMYLLKTTFCKSLATVNTRLKIIHNMVRYTEQRCVVVAWGPLLLMWINFNPSIDK